VLSVFALDIRVGGEVRLTLVSYLKQQSSVMVKFNVDTPQGLAELDKFLLDHSYIEGWTPSTADAEVYSSVKSSPAEDKVNLFRWWTHIGSFGEGERASWSTPSTTTSTSTSSPAKKPAVENKAEDDIDLFGDDDDDEHEKEIERRSKEAQAKKEAAGKKKDALKSAVIIDVKPWEDSTDMAKLEELVRSIKMDGLEWKASKLTEIGFGIKKLQISCHIEDEKVSVDDIQEQIQGFEEYVQSTDIGGFTKL
jgi:elongation factor 1-beta